MSWPEHFVDSLGDALDARAWVWKVRTLDSSPGDGLQDPTDSGEAYMAVTTGGDAKQTHPVDPILAGPPRCSGTRLSPGTWSSTVGGMSFELVGDLTRFRRRVTRGTLLQVLLGRAGWSDDLFEVVHVGRSDGCRMSRGRVTLSIGDALSLVDGRPVDDPDVAEVLYTLSTSNRTSTTLTADYTAGDATINVTSTGSFTRESGASGAIRIGDAIVYYTGKTGTTFTGCSATGEVGTTLADVASGESVYEAALIKGHPITIALKMLTTMDGTNGSLDLYPGPWGLRIWESCVDIEDALTERDRVAVVSSGLYAIEVVAEEPITDPRAWLTSLLATFGMCLTQRHGRLTVRAPSLYENRRRDGVELILNDDLVIVEEVTADWWDQTIDRESASVTAYAASSSTTSAVTSIATLPAERGAEYDASAYVWSNGVAITTEITQRVGPFHTRVPERLVLPCAGLSAWRLAPGDRVLVQVDIPGTRYDYSEGRWCFIVGVTPDPTRNRVSVEALYHPSADDYPWGA